MVGVGASIPIIASTGSNESGPYTPPTHEPYLVEGSNYNVSDGQGTHEAYNVLRSV